MQANHLTIEISDGELVEAMAGWLPAAESSLISDAEHVHIEGIEHTSDESGGRYWVFGFSFIDPEDIPDRVDD